MKSLWRIDMKSETIEMLIEKGMQNGTFDIEIAQILNNEGVCLFFGKEGIGWSRSDDDSPTKPKETKAEEDEQAMFLSNLLAYDGTKQDEVKR